MIKAPKPVIRTITTKWLESQKACEEGIALFKYITGDRCLMSFSGSDFVWMEKHFKDNFTHIPDSIRRSNSQLYWLTYGACFYHVRWLYRRISINSTDLKNSLISAGVDLRKHNLDELATNQPAPINWRHSANTYYNYIVKQTVSELVPDGVPLWNVG